MEFIASNGKVYLMSAPEVRAIGADARIVTRFTYWATKDGKQWGPLRNATNLSDSPVASMIYRDGMAAWAAAHDV